MKFIIAFLAAAVAFGFGGIGRVTADEHQPADPTSTPGHEPFVWTFDYNKDRGGFTVHKPVQILSVVGTCENFIIAYHPDGAPAVTFPQELRIPLNHDWDAERSTSTDRYGLTSVDIILPAGSEIAIVAGPDAEHKHDGLNCITYRDPVDSHITFSGLIVSGYYLAQPLAKRPSLVLGPP